MKYACSLTALAVLFALAASGQPFQPGDLVVSGRRPFPVPPISPDGPAIRQYTPTGSLIRELEADPEGYVGEVGFTSSGTLFAAMNSYIFRFDSNGQQLPSILRPGVRHFAFSASGLVYAEGAGAVSVVDQTGVITTQFVLPTSTIESVDLDPDQCTLYYLDAPIVGRFDVCTGTLLAPVTSSLGTNGGELVRVLTDRTLLVSAGGVLRKFTTMGTLLRTYPINAVLAVHADDRSVWKVLSVVGDDKVERVDIETGTVLSGPITITGLPEVNFLTVVGEGRASFSPSVIPSVSPLGLALIAVCVISIGLARIRGY